MKKFILFSVFAFFIMSGTAFALTTSNAIDEVWGGHRVVMFDLAFDSSYDYGGEFISGNSVRMQSVDHAIVYNKGGYNFEWDGTNKKIKVFKSAPPIVWEERHTATSSNTSFQLDYPAAYIFAVVHAGGTAYPLTYSGITNIGTNQSCLSAPIQDGVRTGLSVYATSGDFLVSYATQAWKDIYDLLVQNERVDLDGNTTVAMSGATLEAGSTVFAIQSMKLDGAETNLYPVDWADTPASGEIGVDFGDSGVTASQFNVNGSQNNLQMYITYLKHPTGGASSGPSKNASWIVDRYIQDEDATSGSSLHQLDRPLLLWCIGGHVLFNGDPPHVIVAEDQADGYFINNFAHTPNVNSASSSVSEVNTFWGWRGSGVSVFSDTAQQSYDMQRWANVDEANGTDLTHATYLFGHPWEIPGLEPLEVTNGTDLSDLTGVKVIFIGR